MKRIFRFVVMCGWALVAASVNAKPLLVLHLDLNTIQMKKSAVLECLQVAAQSGYNAVLWEIEDKVRWESCPECVHPEALTKAEFREILAEARRLNLQPIPLLQTFGHAEYVLLNGGHSEWMEDPKFPACYCVSKPEVRAFLKRLMAEYLELFGPEVKHFHLGGDEAKAFGSCPTCSKRERMQLYVEHLRSLAEPLVRQGIKPGIWCDMVLKEAKAFRTAGLPKDFTIWHWDYVYDGQPNGERREWTDQIGLLKEMGHDIIFTASSASAGDGPFLPRYAPHMKNVAASADLVRRERMLGLCVSSWSVRKFPKALQYPIWDFAAKRLLNPSAAAVDDERQAYERWFGSVTVEQMQSMTGWFGQFGALDGAGWFPYIKHARPAPAGTFARVLKEMQAFDPKHCEHVLEQTRQLAAQMRQGLKTTAKSRSSGPSLGVLTNGLDLAIAFLDRTRAVYAGETSVPFPFAATADYYRREQTEISATNCAAIVWSVLKSAVER